MGVDSAGFLAALTGPLAVAGAGISVSSGIPDFRGPQGVWTLRSQGKRPKGVSMEDAEPTYGTHRDVCAFACACALTEACCAAHRALAALDEVRCVVTTNGDGLHMRAGMGQERLAELHGNRSV